MARIIQITILILLSLLMMSASCDKGTEGCTDDSFCDYQGDGIEDENCACNYDKDAIIDDGSCNYPEENFDCEGKCLTEIDCAGDCGGDAEIDCCGICDIDITNDPPEGSNGDCTEDIQCGCMDHSKCNFIPDATHNDGSCAGDLSEFGGLLDGNDCNEYCGGMAVMDECDLCIGGSTNYGQCWQIGIKSIVTFKLDNGLSMGSDTNSIIIGTAINALDGFNASPDFNNIDCERNYADGPHLTKDELNTNKNNYVNYYIPHEGDDGWDEWWDSNFNFNRDIRSNDYHSLFTVEKGLTWFTIVEPTLSNTIIFDENDNPETFETILDSIYFQITHLEGIQCSQIKIALDREKGEVVNNFDYVIENNQLGIKVDTDNSFSVMINISNICIQDFEESCPADF